MATCTQCGKTAIREMAGHPLCVDCYVKMSQVLQAESENAMRAYNLACDEIEAMTGFYGISPKFSLPTKPIYQYNAYSNHINIDRSVIGVLNTGTIGYINNALTYHSSAGNQELTNAIKEFTEAVVNSGSLTVETKNELLEQLSVLTTQSTLPKESQNKGISRAILSYIPTAIGAANDLSQLWDRLYPLIAPVLGL